MDIVPTNFLPGDPRLIDQIVYELKSQGIFDQFRKECIADVDTKPAYQNLSQRVEGSVMNFLNKQKFSDDINKNQLREQLRKNITESGFLESGVERIVDQVVNPKINTVFLPKVEDVVYRFLGIERPNQENQRLELKPNVEDLLPNDLEAVSPESVNDQSLNLSAEKKDDSVEETNDNSLNSSNTKTEDESPPFEPLEENTKFSVHEENSVDSHLSGISGLVSHDSTHSADIKIPNQMEMSQEISQNSMNSEGNLSIITSGEDTKMEICEDTVMSETSDKLERTNNQQIRGHNQGDSNLDIQDSISGKETTVEKIEENKDMSNNLQEVNSEQNINDKKAEEKKPDLVKNDSRRTHDKHKSTRSDKDRKEDKDKRSRSKSESKFKDSKEHSSTKHSSSSKDKDKKEYTNGKEEKDKISKKEEKERDKSKEKSSSKSKDSKEKYIKSRERSDKVKDKAEKERDRSDKERASKDKDRSNKDKSEKLEKEKDKSETDKHKSRDKHNPDKSKSEKDRHDRDRSSSSKHSKDKSSSSRKDNKEKDKGSSSKDRTSSSSKSKESSSKDKDSTKGSKDKDKSKLTSSSSKDKDRDKRSAGDSKSKPSDKHRKIEKEKPSSQDKNSSTSKKDKEKKITDDHYSLKEKKNDRRSTDRDSNDGSSKMSRNSSFTETYSNSFKGSSKESSEVFSSGGGESSNSDKTEEKLEERREAGDVDLPNMEVASPIKYIKPKFASNIHEAMKIMKIRKQLAKLERQNQLALANVPIGNEHTVQQNIKQKEKEKPRKLTYSSNKKGQANTEKYTSVRSRTDASRFSPKNNGTNVESLCHVKLEDAPVLKSQDLSMESFEALEARLAQEMSNVNVHMYGDEDDSYEYSSISISPVKKRKSPEDPNISQKKILFNDSTIVSSDAKDMNLTKEADINKNGQEHNMERNLVNKLVDSTCEENLSINNSLDSRAGLNNLEVLEESVATNNQNIIFENSNESMELVVGEQLTVPADGISPVQTPEDVASSHDSQIVIEEQIVNEEIITLNNENDLTSMEYKKLTIDKDQEEFDQDIQGALREDVPKISTDETEVIQEDAGHPIDSGADKIVDFYETNDELRGFTISERDNTKLVKMQQLIDKISNGLVKERTFFDVQAHTKRTINSYKYPEKELKKLQDRNMVKIHDGESEYNSNLLIKPEIKEVKHIASMQDLLHKNGKKIFIKIDKLNIELTPKVLVTLQDMDLKELVRNQIGDTIEVKGEVEEVLGELKETMKTLLCGQEVEIKQNGQVANSKQTVIIEKRQTEESLVGKWEDENSPCYYFEKSDTASDTRLAILKGFIGRLEKYIEEQSLKIQNNIPKPKKRGRKRKAHSTENNNSIECEFKPERKRRFLSDANSNQNGDNLCNADVSSQRFSLPLSPAESDKSGEQKKEPVTVKTKRTGRGAANKRYSSEDLYKPRPILSSTSSRRRSGRMDDNRS